MITRFNLLRTELLLRLAGHVVNVELVDLAPRVVGDVVLEVRASTVAILLVEHLKASQ